ncbi:MAG: ATP-dependent DNA ligase [Chloroflexi bacterium]|nr:ATP-dependent DNA ligase [Chloroflexota bacterium]
MSSLFADWVAAATAVRGTTKKLEKQAALAAYFATLDDEDLAIAARLFAGGPFSRADQRVLNVGWSALTDAILERSRAKGDEIGASYQRHADLGDVAAELITSAPPDPRQLTLADLNAAFEEIAATKGSNAKRVLVRALMARATGPEARYVTKIAGGDMRIGLRESLVEEALAKAFGREREAVARANMLGGDIGTTAVRARSGTLEGAAFAYFAPVGMMLATPVLDLAEVGKRFPPPYLVEDKYDGVRAQVHKSGDRVEVFSRTLDRVTDRFPELLDALRALPGSLVLDAEILAFREGRAIPFVDFQRRLGRKEVGGEMQSEMPSSLVAFDILERDGRPLLELPLAERSALLRALPLEGPLRVPDQRRVDLTGDDLVQALEGEFSAARERGNEGLMVKDPRSPYRPGRRGMEWLKVKRALTTLDVVVVAVEWGHGKRHGVLSDYTFAVRDDEGRLRTIGKAYSGLTDTEIAEMTDHFLAHTREDRGRIRSVDPDTVIEVAFDSIQPSDRHESGLAMRFPRIVRLRPDKPVSEIDTLATALAIAARQGGAP